LDLRRLPTQSFAQTYHNSAIYPQQKAKTLTISPALRIKVRDPWLRWSPRQVKERRRLIAQNARFLVPADPGRWAHLVSRGLKLACEPLPQDWQEHFGFRNPLN